MDKKTEDLAHRLVKVTRKYEEVLAEIRDLGMEFQNHGSKTVDEALNEFARLLGIMMCNNIRNRS